MRKILTYPNSTLEQKSHDVVKFDKSLNDLLDEMKEIMNSHGNCVGLTAIQIGVPLNVVVVQFEKEYFELINPQIVSEEGSKTLKEGCLSIPGVNDFVKRSNSVVIKWQSRKGTNSECEFTDTLARIFQHELEHLEGKLYIDNLSNTKRKINPLST